MDQNQATVEDIPEVWEKFSIRSAFCAKILYLSNGLYQNFVFKHPLGPKSIWVWVQLDYILAPSQPTHPVLFHCLQSASKPHWWKLTFASLHFQLLALTHQPRHNLDMYLGEVNWTMPLNKSPIKVQSCAQRRFYLWRHRKWCQCVYILCKKSISQGVSEMSLTSVSLTCWLQRCHFRALLTSPQTLSENWKREQD